MPRVRIPLSAWPPPNFEPTAAAAVHIFEMSQSDPILTFARLDGLMLLDYALLIVDGAGDGVVAAGQAILADFQGAASSSST